MSSKKKSQTEKPTSALSSSDDNIQMLRPPERKRKASHKCSGSKQVLPEWISDWKLRHAEKHVHIFYDKDYLATPKDVLQKIQTPKELDENQRQHILNLQKFFDIDSNLDEFCHCPGVIQEKLDRLSTNRASQTELDSQNQKFVSSLKGEKFIIALYRLFEKIQKQRRKRFKLYEGMFTQLIVALGEICYLEAELCSAGDETIWENLRGCERVISRPDCRFYKQQMNFNSTIRPSTIVSVNKVKNAKRFEGFEPPGKRQKKRFKRPTCSKSSTEESYDESDFSSSSSSVSRLYKEYLEQPSTEQLPEILCDLNTHILGQHAGELLLDLHEYRSDGNSSVFTLPGMIVDGTKVFFTLLVMSKDHHEKLCKNLQLDESDTATIYYARPLDLLGLQSRNLLIESLVRLNSY